MWGHTQHDINLNSVLPSRYRTGLIIVVKVKSYFFSCLIKFVRDVLHLSSVVVIESAI